MSEETFDKIYGKKGIDTSYEREKILYRPDIHFNKESLRHIIRPEIQQSIERSRTFMISHNLLEYDELISDVDQMLQDIESRNPREKMSHLKEPLLNKQFKEVISFEKQQSGYRETGDYELYSLLYYMKNSMEVRKDFIDQHFRTQITNETDIKKIQEIEFQSINDWEQLEAKVIESYKYLSHDEDEDIENASLLNEGQITYEFIETLEQQKRNQEILHTSLADISYVHRNRYFMFLNIVEQSKILVYNPDRLIDKNLKDFIMSVKDISNWSSPKSHLILQFRKLREKHESFKGRMMTIDDEKETFASEKQYMYQQLESKTIEPLKRWMHEQEEGYSGSLDLFSKYMVKSIKESRLSYEESLADMLNFYKSEVDFYEKQIHFLKEKEEIRRFYRILEDLEDAEKIHEDWVVDYLKVNGYTV